MTPDYRKSRNYVPPPKPGFRYTVRTWLVLIFLIAACIRLGPTMVRNARLGAAARRQGRNELSSCRLGYLLVHSASHESRKIHRDR